MWRLDVSAEAEVETFEAALRYAYGVFFTITDDVVTVIAVLHLHRHPDTWKARRRP